MVYAQVWDEIVAGRIGWRLLQHIPEVPLFSFFLRPGVHGVLDLFVHPEVGDEVVAIGFWVRLLQNIPKVSILILSCLGVG